ncbi:hypothetical protein [Streptomyces puniciscabiei]|uniref:hypothetical protein n=1 Tax=Streptomyces puniciscabiei TaxID=164348 RepID=UPI0037AE89BD
MNTAEDKLELIAGGPWVCIAPAGSTAVLMRPDLAAVPLAGVEPGHVVLATRAGERSRLLTAFRRAAQSCLTAPGPWTHLPK